VATWELAWCEDEIRQQLVLRLLSITAQLIVVSRILFRVDFWILGLLAAMPNNPTCH